MERLRVGDEFASLVMEVTPNDLREIANKIEARAKGSMNGTTVLLPISNSITLLYNVPMKDAYVAPVKKDPTIHAPVTQTLQ